MILIADSGSTKVHWCLVTASGQSSDVFTDGINPLFQTTIAMQNSISNQLLPKIAPLLWAGTLTHIFFYGAGCTPEKKVFVQKALEAVFKKAQVLAPRGVCWDTKPVWRVSWEPAAAVAITTERTLIGVCLRWGIF